MSSTSHTDADLLSSLAFLGEQPALHLMSGARHPPCNSPASSPASESRLTKEMSTSTDDSNCHNCTDKILQDLKKITSVGDGSLEVGQASEDRINFKTLEFWQVGLLMIAEIMSLGVLSLPAAVAELGFFPGLFTIVGFGLVATYSGYVIGQFKIAHPSVMSMGDAGGVLFGRTGEWIFNAAVAFFLLFIAGAHVLTFSVALNVITGHAICTVAYAAIGMLVSLFLTLPRTLRGQSYVSIASCISIVAAIFVTMITIALRSKTEAAGVVAIDTHSDMRRAMVKILNVVTAYAGNVAFFNFISEMKKPKEYVKALAILQGTTVVFYTVVATVVYFYYGPGIMAPALGSAGDKARRVAYGLALVTIIGAGVINGHICARNIYETFWRHYNASMVDSKCLKARLSWYGLCTGIWIIAFVIAESITVFEELLALVSALFGCWFTYGVSGFLWLHLNKGSYTSTWKKKCLFGASIGLILLAGSLSVLGSYATIARIVETASKAGGAWSCANNSDPR